MKIEIPVSLSARQVKRAPKSNYILLKAKRKFEITDDTHESLIKRGDVFYIVRSGTKHFLFDPEGSTFFKFVITAAEFKTLKTSHTIVDDSSNRPQARKAQSKRTKVKGTRVKRTRVKGTRVSKPDSLMQYLNESKKVFDIESILWSFQLEKIEYIKNRMPILPEVERIYTIISEEDKKAKVAKLEAKIANPVSPTNNNRGEAYDKIDLDKVNAIEQRLLRETGVDINKGLSLAQLQLHSFMEAKKHNPLYKTATILTFPDKKT